MTVIYVAGPYRSKKGIIGIRHNIQRAETVALKYWKLGYCVICPHLNTALMDGINTDEMFLEGGLELILRCDIVVAMKGWKNSSGSIEEIHLAYKLNKEIIYE